MRVAYFSPLNPQRSGISDYSEELLPHLASGAEIDLFVDGFAPSNPSVAGRFRWFDYRRDPARLSELSAYDVALYHMGNDHRYHAGVYEAALAHPGVVVLHDFALQHFFLGLARTTGAPSLYLDELEACHGPRARADAEQTLRRGGTPAAALAPLSFPLNRRLANAAEGLVVHSEWSRTRLSQVAPAVPVARINLPVVPEDAGARDSEAVRGPRRVEIASFGHITTEKGIERTLAALASLGEGYNFHYTLVGQPDGFDVTELARHHKLAGRVTVTGFVTLEEFKARIRATDIAVNLRERTVGETSASVCRIMAAGVPVLVSDVGWFSELPDDAVVKIDAGEGSDAQLRAFLARLIADEPLRRRIGENARLYVLAEHSIERSAAAYLDFLSETVRLRNRRRLTRRVSTELAALGVGPDDDSILRRVAAEVVRLAPADEVRDEG
ncbi:MAG TPA: glycosyltransferase family 4 protein [Pyrinomonadaceae bacterium]|nr:glycosyltransferase family 4 protein [Pyrinomonadaceae bacterium]